MKRLGELFWGLFKISLFVIGGGYSILAVAENVFVRKGWLREDELLEHLPVFQMVPGLIATHTAVYVGSRVAGPIGAAIGVVAVAIPSVAIFTAVSVWYGLIPLDNPWLNSSFVGLRAALTGIIAATIVRSWCKFIKDAFSYALLIAGVTTIVLLRVPIAAVIVASAACGVMSTFARGDGMRFKSSSLVAILLFAQYGSLCLGGGFVLVPMYMQHFVGDAAPYLQLTEEEFSNVMALTQMTPGPIGVNCATYFGYRLAGIFGAVAASALLLAPGSFAMYFVLRSLDKFRESRLVGGIMRGAKPASIALMLVALWTFARMTVVNSLGKFNTTGAILGILCLIISMKRKLNVILLILLSAGAACLLRAEEVTVENYPDADAVILEEREHAEYAPDGTTRSVSESWVKILTERGRREEGELSLGYNARYGTAKVLYVGVIGEDGREREIDVSSTTKDMTDNSSLAENIVDPLDRTLVCTIPGLKIGEVVHIKAERSMFKARTKDQWSDLSIMEWECPILKSVYEVKAPKERPIKSRAVRHPLGNVSEQVIAQDDGSTLYVYTATNSPRIFAEPDMPPTWNVVQAVHLSTASNWKELSRWYWDVCEPHLAKTTPAITNKVEELGRDLNAIFKFVSQEIRYMGLTMEDTAPGYAPHDVDITFDNRYGVCRDKGALLVAMLRIAGYDAYPVLINVGAKMDPDVPKPYFNHAITCVATNGTYLLMDATNENTKDLCPAYLCNCSYLVARPEGEDLLTSPIPSPDLNLIDVKTRGKLANDGTILLESSYDFTGFNDTVYRGVLVKATPENRVKIFESRIKALQPGSELISCEITPEDLRDTSVPLHVRLVAKLPETVLRGETEDTLAFPFMSRPFAVTGWLLGDNTALEKRRYPLVIDTTARVHETVEIDLGTALGDLQSLPAPVDIRGGYAFTRTFELRDGKLRAERTHTIGDVEFDPDEYRQLRENMKAMEAVERKNPIFSSDGAKGANLRWLDETSELDILSDTAWTVTNSFRQEVLTYRGKKDAAELSLSYNPTWKNIEVISAVVSNLDGTVQSVKPFEMNELDSQWAATAPRYPAGKTLIVNLPAVEIGSVISVTTASTVTNAPAPYYGTFGFDSREPLSHRKVRVGDWVREVTHPKRVPDEPSQPSGILWRDVMILAHGTFAQAAVTLRQACEVEPLDWQAVPIPNSNSCPGTVPTITDIRDWMAKNVRIAGPSLYEVPIPQQLTAPQTVVAEHYATRLDYIRTLCALLKGAGYDADIVFAAPNAGEQESIRRRDKYDHPNVRAFSYALCRIRETSGSFFGMGGETTTYYIGLENEFTPLGTSEMCGCDFFDPHAETFGVVEAVAANQRPRTELVGVIDISPDGSIELMREMFVYGAAVGGFRKRYAEILPEDFNRHYQALLSDVAKAAKPKGELSADVGSYPAKLKFVCTVPDFATVAGDAITIRLPPLQCPIPALTGTTRQTPFVLSAQGDTSNTVVIRFPEGYTEVEHLPESFEFRDPKDPSHVLLRNTVEKRVEGNRLVVSIRREVVKRFSAMYGPEYAELFRDWHRLGISLASRTLVARKSAALHTDAVVLGRVHGAAR